MAYKGMAAGGMVSNHRLVLFTHALCRLSYPAVRRQLPAPPAPVWSKLLTRERDLPGARCVAPKQRGPDGDARPLRRAIRLPFGAEHSFLPPGGN